MNVYARLIEDQNYVDSVATEDDYSGSDSFWRDMYMESDHTYETVLYYGVSQEDFIKIDTCEVDGYEAYSILSKYERDDI